MAKSQQLNPRQPPQKVTTQLSKDLDPLLADNKAIEISKAEEKKAEEVLPFVNQLQAFAQQEMAKITPRVETHRLQIDCSPLSQTIIELIETQLANRTVPEDLPYKYDGHICGGQSVLILRCFNLNETKELLKTITSFDSYAQQVIISDFTKGKAETTQTSYRSFIGE